MKPFLLSFAVCILFAGVHTMHAQNRSAATMNGAAIVSGTASITSQGHEDTDNRYTTFSLSPSALWFVSPGFALGADLSLTHIAYNSESTTSIGIGPKAGYFFDSGTSTIPYLGGGVSYVNYGSSSSDADTGYRIKLAGGLLLRKDHLGFIIEAGYMLETIDRGGLVGDRTYNTIFVAFGFAGLFY